ncbi:MAG TPA: EamA family transporter [Clostridium sp.]|nr:EamA family transporter [Clostridium sp.]
MKSKNSGYLFAIITILIWGTTFISTKILLVDFEPTEILFLRFLIGFIALIVVCPKRLRIEDKKREFVFALAGLCGICMYYLLENIALTYTMASNVGVIISAAPFFTGMLSKIFIKDSEKLHMNFYIGFIIAMVGVFCISFSGQELHLNPMGDLLAVGAAFVWACYSVITKKISSWGYSTIQTTRRTFAYGLVFIIPSLFLFHQHSMDFYNIIKPLNLFNILFLGLGASALCFVTWNLAVKVLGAVKTTSFIYMVPVITIISSVIILNEPITKMEVLGTVLTLTGLIVSEKNIFSRITYSKKVKA